MPQRRRNRPGIGGGRRPSEGGGEARPPARGGRGVGRGGLSVRRPIMRPSIRRKVRRWFFIGAASVVAILVIGSFGITSFPGLNQRGTGATGYKEGVGVPQELLPTAFHLNNQDIGYQPDVVSTTLAIDAAQGTTVVTVSRLRGFTAGDSVQIDVGEVQETAAITAIDGGQLTLDTALAHDHASGVSLFRPSKFSIPPTSGDHWATASAPTRCGFYEEGVRDEVTLHNLEHGNVIMSYNLTDPEDIGRLREVHDGLPVGNEWLVTRFYPTIPEGDIALAAWGVLDHFTGIQEDRIEEFFKAYRGNRFSDEGQSLGRGIPCTTTARHGG